MKVALVGLGQIALTKHIPAINNSPDWELAATVSRTSRAEGVVNYATIEQLLAAQPDITTISLCMPPIPRFAIAKAVIDNGRHVMLEKPPGVTISECNILSRLAAAANVTLYATWHSREAAMIDLAKNWLADKAIESFEIVWKEDIQHWHHGQDWSMQPGGLGVFDPGINALSILTKILPEPVRLSSAVLETPTNWYTPIAVTLQMISDTGAAGSANFDWRQKDGDIWEIRIDTDAGLLHLMEGGAKVTINGLLQSAPEDSTTVADEYSRLYQRMHELIMTNSSECDLTPLELVADAFMLGRHEPVAEFKL